MINLFQVVVLSIIEGLSEFLPISSTGHLILASSLLHIQSSEFLKTFEIVIQFGAILSVLFLYTRRFATNLQALLRLAASFIPTAVIGFILYHFIKSYLLGNTLVVAVSLLVGGILILLAERFYRPETATVKRIEDTSYPKAIGIGLAQSLAVIPGVSRSAATIIGGLFLGLDRKTATEYSFLLAVPTMAAATGLDLLETSFSYNTYQISMLLFGCLVSFIVATIAIKSFVLYVQRHNFNAFAWYRIAVGILFLLFFLR